MLSDHERRELSFIEQRLREDPRLAASLGDGARPERRWPIRLLVCVGILLIVTGLLTVTAGLLLQGLLAVGAGITWSRWRASRSARARSAPD
ncbi:MAG: DUF3040 domain-containing protein [Mycobacteriales bacterium]